MPSKDSVPCATARRLQPEAPLRTSSVRRRSASLLPLFALGAILLAGPRLVAEPQTEIVVVGTVHSATPSYSVKDLIAILDRVRPAVVLFEYPAEMMTGSFEFKSIVKGDLEQEAVLDYVRRTGAKIRPYDIDGRNAFYKRTDYFNRQRACNRELNAQVQTNALREEARKILDALDSANARRDAIGQSSPSVINSFQSDTAINEKQWLMNQGIPEIVRLTPALKGCEAFWNLSRAEWTRRNNEMVRNIKRLATEFAGKRLIVLCGYEHRYWLRSGLQDADEPAGYVVKEYSEY